MSNWLNGLRRFGLLLIIACAALLASSGLMRAQSFNITNVTKNSASKASFPTMVVDSQGNLDVVWVDSVRGLQFARSTSSANGSALGAPVTIMGPNGSVALPSFQPQMAVNPTQPSQIEITWAVPDSPFTPTVPLYDVFASFSNDSGANFATSLNVSGTNFLNISGPVALFDSPRVAFDSTGTVNVVWGRTGVWISQATDGVHFGLPMSLLPPPPTPAPDTGGPRIAVSGSGHIFVAWTDEASKGVQTSYCTPGTPSTTTVGGNFWMNETLPSQPPTPPNFSNTRNLSNTDWASSNRSAGDIQRFPNGFFGCSYDNLKLYTDKSGNVHLLWSDDSPIADVLNSKTLTNGSGFTTFSFPINIANHSAAAPDAAVDKNGSIYVVWSGDATPGSNSQGIFFSRSDDGGGTFTSCAPGQQPLCPATNIAPSGAAASAFPRVAVDASGNVNVAWEQPTAAITNGSNVFNVFFARSTDKGVTFPIVAQVSASPSVLCFENDPPPAGNGALPTTPDMSTCGTVQIGVDANSTPDMVWVNQASGSAVSDIDFATPNFPTGSVSPTTASLSASNASQNFTLTVNPGGPAGPITFSCLDADKGGPLPSWLSCSQSTTNTLMISRVGTPTTSIFLSPPSSHSLPVFGRPTAWSLVFATLSVMAVLLLAMGRRREVSRAVLMRGFLVMTLTVVVAAGLVSCGGSTSGSSGTTSSGGTTSGAGSGGGTTAGSGGGTGGSGTSVTVHVAVMAQSGSAAAVNFGTVTITAQ